MQAAEPASLAAELRDDKTRTLTSLLLAPRYVCRHFTLSSSCGCFHLWCANAQSACAVMSEPQAENSRAKSTLQCGFQAIAGT